MNLTITKEEANVLYATLETQAVRLHRRADTLREQAGTLDRLCRLATVGSEPAQASQSSEWCRFDTVKPPKARWLLVINTKSMVSWVVFTNTNGQLTDRQDLECQFPQTDFLYLVLPKFP